MNRMFYTYGHSVHNLPYLMLFQNVISVQENLKPKQTSDYS